MKLDALDHPKTLEFAAQLNVSRPTAIGHLELFWHFVAKHAPRGNVGKFPDGAIARASEWNGDPESFLKALLKSGLIDVSDAHRYLVHDWPEHCPNWVRAQLQKLKTPFFTTEVRAEEPTEGRTYESSSVRSTRARVSKPSDTKPRDGGGATEEPVDTFELMTRIQSIYPQGTYTGVTWHQAERELGKLLDAGEDPELLVASTVAYRDQQQAMGKVGTQFIRSPKTFFGEGHWRGPFDLPKSRAETALDSNIEAGRQFLAGGAA